MEAAPPMATAGARLGQWEIREVERAHSRGRVGVIHVGDHDELGLLAPPIDGHQAIAGRTAQTRADASARASCEAGVEARSKGRRHQRGSARIVSQAAIAETMNSAKCRAWGSRRAVEVRTAPTQPSLCQIPPPARAGSSGEAGYGQGVAYQ